jgi:putative spermidine/putrescine transport system permease protein
VPLLLLAPALVLIFVFLVYPLIGIVLRSFDPLGDLSYSSPSFTLDNYKAMWTDPAARIILKNTFIIAGLATVACVVIAYPIAYFLTRLPARWANALLFLTVIGLVTSIVVRLFALMILLQKVGLLFTNTATVIGMVMYLLPYAILIFYGGMVGIDDDLTRAARSLGASPTKAFLRVFVPLSRPAVLAGALIVFVLGLGFFLTPALLGPPSGITVSMYIQQEVDQSQWGQAGAMGVSLLVIALIIYYLFDRLFGLDRVAGGGAQIRRRSTRGEGSTVVLVLLGICTVIVFALIMLPLISVVLVSFSDSSLLEIPPSGYSTQWYDTLFADPTWGESAWLSLRVAALCTLIATIAGLLAAAVLARRFRGRRILRALFLMPMIVPVIMIAAAVFDLESRMRLAGTTLGYAVGHALLALPFVVIVCATALAELGSSLQEAARSLGASAFTSFRKVTLPLILPSVITGAALAFIVSWDEPVMSLMLQRFSQTLPVHIFSFVKEQVQPTVAALSTVILGGVIVLALLGFVFARLIASRRGTAMPAADAVKGS